MEFLKKIWSKILFFIKRITDDNIGLYAAQSSFFIITSSIPFIMLLLSLAKYVIPISENDILKAIAGIFPTDVYNYISNIIREIFIKMSDSFLSIAIITLFWSASSGMVSLILGLDKINKDKNTRSYLKSRILSVFYTLLLILGIFLSIAALIFGKQILAVLTEHYSFLAPFETAIHSLRIVILFIYLSLMFALLYTHLPIKKNKLKSQWPGAIFATFGWFAFSEIYSIYISEFSNFSFIYGSLTAVIFLMLWLYFCLTIFLWGAEINQIIYENKMKKK